MSLYTKFIPTMKNHARHMGMEGENILDMWETILRMIGEEKFNEWITRYVNDDDECGTVDIAIGTFVKGLRQWDNFSGFMRQKETQVPHPNQEKFPDKMVTRMVNDHDISGSVDMLVRNMLSLDTKELFCSVFDQFFTSYKNNPDIPVIEFVFEDNMKKYDSGLNGLVGVRTEGEEEFWDEDKIKEELGEVGQMSFLVIQAMKHYRQNTGKEEKPTDGPSYAALDSPIYRSSREVEDIVSYESQAKKPFKWTNTIVQPQKEKV